MKVWIENKKRADGWKWIVKVVYTEKGKQRTQTKAIYNSNEKKLANDHKKNLEKKEKIDLIDQKIEFNFAFSEYFKVINKDPDTTQKYKDMQIAYINNHVKPYINQQYLSEYLLANFLEETLIDIKKSKRLDWRIKDGKGCYVKRLEPIGKVTIKAVVLEFKKFVNWCLSRQWKIDYSIANYKFPKKYFTDYTEQEKWMPTSKELLLVINKEPDIKLKTFYKCAAETGVRLNELLGICYESVDFKNGGINIDHSVNSENNFRPYQVKTSKRFIEISDELLELFSIWMKAQMFPITHRNKIFTNPYTGKIEKRTFKRVFNITGSRANKKIKQSAKKLGIDWQNGMSPFRKWSISRMEELKILTEKQMNVRFANSKEIRDKNYIRDLNLNETKRKAAINQITKG